MIHLQQPVNDWTQAITRLPAGSVVKAVDNVQALDEAKRLNPAITTCLRHWYDPGQVFGGSLVDNMNRARLFLASFVDGTFAQYAANVDYIEEWNEYLAGSQTSTELAQRVMWAEAVANVWKNEYRILPQYAHIRLVLCNTAIGNDIDRQFAEIAAHYDCVMGYHAYTQYRQGVRDPGDWQYLSGRWVTMDNDYRAHGFHVDWLFTEAGPFESVETGWRHPACLGGDVNAYIGAVRTWLRDVQTTHAYQTGRTLGFCLFTTGGGQSWQYYETRQPELNLLADIVAVEWHPGATLPPPPPPPVEVLGLDVSRWQGAINWDTAYSRGARFVFCKATEHVSWTDPLFAQNVIGAKHAGLITGAYHFYKPTYDPIEQADHFTNTVGGRVDMPLVLDVEDSVGAPSTFADDVRDCLEHIATVTGRRPVLYTSPGFYAGWLATARLFEVADLWIAHWTSLPTPTVPMGFGGWHFWQYTNQGNGPEWGVSSARVDLNRWNGTLEALQEYAYHVEPFPSYASTVNLMPPNGEKNHQWETVIKYAWPRQETIAWSAHDCVKLATTGLPGRVKVWFVDAWGQDIVSWLQNYGVENIELWPRREDTDG